MAAVTLQDVGPPTCSRILKCKSVLEILKWNWKIRITMHTQKNKHRCKQANKFGDILFSLPKYSACVCVWGGARTRICLHACVCDFHLTKGIRKACLKYSVWFPLRPSVEDRSLLETDSVCMNHSVVLCMWSCVFICTGPCLYACLYAWLSNLFLSHRLHPPPITPTFSCLSVPPDSYPPHKTSPSGCYLHLLSNG